MFLMVLGARGPCWEWVIKTVQNLNKLISCLFSDEGGPMVIQSFDMSFKAIGVFSTLHTLDCDIGSPARYTRVTSHLEWIKENWMEAIPV